MSVENLHVYLYDADQWHVTHFLMHFYYLQTRMLQYRKTRDETINFKVMYRIAGNFRRLKISYKVKKCFRIKFRILIVGHWNVHNLVIVYSHWLATPLRQLPCAHFGKWHGYRFYIYCGVNGERLSGYQGCFCW